MNLRVFGLERLAAVLRRLHLSRLIQLGKPVLRRVLRNAPLTVTFEGLRIQGSFDNWWILRRIKDGRYEPFSVKIFQKALEPGMIVLDIGANIGFFSLLAARAVGSNGKVYAFEPDSRNLQSLRANVKQNKFDNVVIVAKAVTTDESGTRSFHMRQTAAFSGLHAASWGEIVEVAEVEAVSIDDLLGGESVDVVKIDIEGGEPAALQGMSRTLGNSPNAKVFVEFEPPNFLASGWSSEDFLALLNSLDRGCLLGLNLRGRG